MNETEEKNDRPLGLPTGSVRSILTLVIVATSCFAVIKQSIATGSLPEWFVVLAGAAIGYYFNKKQ